MIKHTLMHKNLINAKHKRYQIYEVNTCLCGLGGVFFFFLGCQLVLNRRRYSLCLSTQQYLHLANLGHRFPIQSITGMTIQLNSVWSARVYFNSMMLTQNSFRNNTTSSIIVMGHGFPSKIFFSADHSTMQTSKALHITFSN